MGTTLNPGTGLCGNGGVGEVEGPVVLQKDLGRDGEDLVTGVEGLTGPCVEINVNAGTRHRYIGAEGWSTSRDRDPHLLTHLPILTYLLVDSSTSSLFFRK